MKIAIIYHSGVGNTALVSKIICAILERKGLTVYLKSVEDVIEPSEILDSEAIVFGFPTYHAGPSTSMKNFIISSNWINCKKPYFVFTTYGLYSANSLRIFAKYESIGRLVPIHYSSYRMAATDGVLVAPFLRYFGTFESNLVDNIKKDLNFFLDIIRNPLKEHPKRIPPVKIYSVLNYPNKVLGMHMKRTIIVNDRCVRCNKCVEKCPHGSLSLNANGCITHNITHCENCYRCIHGCLHGALSLNNNKPKAQLTDKVFDNFFEESLNNI